MLHQTQSAESLAGAMPEGLVAYLRGENTQLSDLECELLVALGADAYRAERHADAAAMFRTHLLARPNSARSWYLLAMCHDAVEDLERAVTLYELAALAPDQGSVTHPVAVYRARALWALDRHEEAEQVLESLEDVDLPPELESIRTELVNQRRGAR